MTRGESAGVRYRGVSKWYGDVHAVKEIDLDVADGEFLVLVGPSGCGKSTLLRMTAGLEDISGGTLELGGQVVNDVDAAQRDVAMVFQSYALYPHRTVRGNLAYALRLRRMPKQEIAARVDAVAEMLDIQELLDRRPGQLSGGQAQRVALGRAIIRQPTVFLMDEPLSNLDAKLRVQMRAELIRLHREVQTTTVFVTHDQVEAMTMGHRIAVLDHGVLQQVGPPRDVYERPANLFVAGFLGAPPMNLVEAELISDGGVSHVRADGVWAPVPPAVEAGLDQVHRGRTERTVALGVRPEQLEVVASDTAGQQPDDAATGDVIIQGTVDVVELLGGESYLHIITGTQRFTAKVPSSMSFDPGARITLRANSDAAHYFDLESGIRLDSALDRPALGAV
ncbi:sn-glycerol-3-phosphate ABC transporter ATP-binding protein UgpC [Actinobacteria bacterium YIM 96077]|uniref:Glycerol-3-phosphate ABC transporter ATP-binding protein n=1 Tax=Phytoactinopolyspora halophila TaxID=1981511 RepID=A0A329QYP7_9ACTN|nr:sn-glycerol-3-phosphate ABC transporter ATP-binding protein UgpC [Phytoactinopolyspora halophila]AYY13320.1 sn-glycerol-3-phosphate ABC transporter ATP-binding protein UgpC [Actinobacteria bacterium YIM 96077]RAW17445.1 glycerol-3-phosphate ABC transporter ATP-binding protein [Phytoactinopolyspora halophila]